MTKVLMEATEENLDALRADGILPPYWQEAPRNPIGKIVSRVTNHALQVSAIEFESDHIPSHWEGCWVKLEVQKQHQTLFNNQYFRYQNQNSPNIAFDGEIVTINLNVTAAEKPTWIKF